MKRNNHTKTTRKLAIKPEVVRVLTDDNLRAVAGGFQSGHTTCDSAFCQSGGTYCPPV